MNTVRKKLISTSILKRLIAVVNDLLKGVFLFIFETDLENFEAIRDSTAITISMIKSPKKWLSADRKFPWETDISLAVASKITFLEETILIPNRKAVAIIIKEGRMKTNRLLFEDILNGIDKIERGIRKTGMAELIVIA